MGWSDDPPSCWQVYCMFGELPALMLVSWITGGRWWWKKQERRMRGTVKSAQRMTGVLTPCFPVSCLRVFEWKTPRSEFFWGFGQRSDFENHMQDTKVTKKGVRDSCLGHSFSLFLYSWWCLFPCFESCWCYVFVFCRVNDKTLSVWRKAGFWTNQPLLIWVNVM